MKMLAYDSETSGLPLWHNPSHDPGQPHIVELAAVLRDEDGTELAVIDTIIKPDGWTIPAEVVAIHGITTEMAMDLGRPEKEVLEEFHALWKQCDFRVAHNESFDARILRIAYFRHLVPEAEWDMDVNLAEHWKAGIAKCTQKLSTPILKIPPTAKMSRAGFNKFKSANLGEAFEFFTGEKFVNAHRAMPDCRACIRVWDAIKARGATGADGQRQADEAYAPQPFRNEEPRQPKPARATRREPDPAPKADEDIQF